MGFERRPDLERGLEDFKADAADARGRRECVICRKPPTFYSDAGRREYEISGVCEPCFDRMFATDDDFRMGNR